MVLRSNRIYTETLRIWAILGGHAKKALLGFLRWRTLRVEGQLRIIAQNTEVGPLPLSAAHAARGLQLVLGICASGQNLAQADLDQMITDLRTARESLSYSLANLDLMIGLVEEAEKHF